MTRARLIEKVIAEWMASLGAYIDSESGLAHFYEYGFVINPAVGAADIDAEFDRIAQEAAR